MPLLDRNGLKQDVFAVEHAPGTEHPGGVPQPHLMVPWPELAGAVKARKAGQRLGVTLPNTVGVSDIGPLLDELSLIAVTFPSFSDGRGFSLARQLRHKGYAGVLRATGPLIPDQFAYALACGFDEVDIPVASIARQPLHQWLEAVATIGATYQEGYGPGRSIPHQRHRLAESPGP